MKDNSPSLSDTPSLTAQLAEESSWEKKATAAAGGSTEDAKKDIGELGLEMVDQFSLAAGELWQHWGQQERWLREFWVMKQV